ncbi:MAG TPA: hypothetical protein VM841_10515 [Actinomycetota bacterium]|nr:hypothetical protein [Actinomycetota bacterium]
MRHARILIVLTIIGLLGALAIGATQEPRYEATSRVSLGGWDPNDGARAKTLADSARAIATSDLVVRRAISTIDQERDVGEVADSIVLTAAGSSSVVDITASDKDPHAAASIANGIALALIDVRSNMLRGGVQTLLDDLDRRMAEADERNVTLEAAARAAAPGTQAAQVALQQYTAAVRQRAELDVDRRQIVQIGAAQPRAAVLDSANVPASPSGTPHALRLMLGLVAGLLGGLAIAAASEVLRPTVMGSEAIAAAAGAPWLGTVPAGDPEDLDEREATVTRAIRLAATRADVRSVLVVPVGTEAGAADDLASSLKPEGEPESEPAGGPVPGSRIAIVDRSAPSDGGIVAVAPEALHRKSLAVLHHVAAASGWPLLGFVLVQKKRGRRRHPQEVVFKAVPRLEAEPASDDGFRGRHVPAFERASEAFMSGGKPKAGNGDGAS